MSGARLTHSTSKDEDVFTVSSSTPTRVDAIVDQATTTTTPKSNRQFTATVDKLPTSVTVDLVHQGEKQTIDYSASAPIDLVQASDTAIGDTSHPGSYTQSVYEVHGVPTHVNVGHAGLAGHHLHRQREDPRGLVLDQDTGRQRAAAADHRRRHTRCPSRSTSPT